MRRLTIAVRPMRADDPVLGHELAIAKHNKEPVTLMVRGFPYEVELEQVTIEIDPPCGAPA